MEFSDAQARSQAGRYGMRRGTAWPGISAVDCEQPTAFCGLYSLPNAVTIYKELDKSLVIGFSRQANGLDITLPLDARSSMTAKPNDFQAFGACMVTLSERGLSNLRR
jgi:hypothetical protein